MDAVNKQFLSAQLFIDGKFVDAASGETMDIINPADGAAIGTLVEGVGGGCGSRGADARTTRSKAAYGATCRSSNAPAC